MASSEKMLCAYPIGMVCLVERPTLNNPANSKAVVYDHYKLGRGYFGVGLIFENGAYDGFSEQDAEMCMVTPVRLCQSLTQYQFKNVTRLSHDFAKGLFSPAFT